MLRSGNDPVRMFRALEALGDADRAGGYVPTPRLC